MAMASTMRSNDRYKNLQILPKDITEKQMDSVMNAFTKALKVSCDFCHVPAKKELLNLTGKPEDLDFSLDSPMKEEARKMIQLTRDINTKYFYDSTIRTEYLQVVGCNTCHRGNPYPAYE
jgi:hypothetical protein